MTLATAKSKLAKLTHKSTLTKSLLGVVGAGALLVSAPAKSDAQVYVAARFGRPAAVVVEARPTAYEIRRREEIRRDEIRREEIRRHEEWLRAHRHDRAHYGYYR
ncbi:MAG TPA: hypothetical protein VN612_16315 [Acidobacteriaceae bacterium]|nr:hypothetical protein [Acidobacteriaceae bacterium]